MIKVTNKEELIAKMESLREAQKKFATYSQEEVDKIFREAAMAANNNRIKLAKLAFNKFLCKGRKECN